MSFQEELLRRIRRDEPTPTRAQVIRRDLESGRRLYEEKSGAKAPPLQMLPPEYDEALIGVAPEGCPKPLYEWRKLVAIRMKTCGESQEAAERAVSDLDGGIDIRYAVVYGHIQ